MHFLYGYFRKNKRLLGGGVILQCVNMVESCWNVMANGDAWEGKWRGNWWMEWVASTLHTTSEYGVSSITAADEHNSVASSWLNWHPCQFKWTRPFQWKAKSGFCACTITFQLASTFRYKTKKRPSLLGHSRMLQDCIINMGRQWQKQKNCFTLYYTVDNWQFLQIGAPLSADSHFYSVNFSILSIQAVVFLQLL